MIRYLTLAGRTMFTEYLEHWGGDVGKGDVRVLRYEHLIGQKQFEPGTYVFTTFDEVHGPLAQYVDALAASLRASPHVRILNDPARMLKRFDLHDALWRAGRNAYRSFRANGDWSAARYPVFVRAEDDHEGAFSPLLHSVAEVDTWIGRAAAFGRSLEHLLVIEFCDTSDGDGYYRKYAAFNVGGRIVARGLSYGRSWMLKFGGSDFTLGMAREEIAYARENPHAAELREIFAIANIDYGRIDYAMLDGRIQTWEINSNPTVGRGARPGRHAMSEEVAAMREECKRVFYDHLNPAWLALDAESPGRGTEPLDVRIDPIVIQRARDDQRRKWRTRRGMLEHCIRLATPLLKTPLAPLVRAIYRTPQRVVRTAAAPLFRLLGRRARNRTNASA